MAHPLCASVFFDKRLFEENRHYALKLSDIVILKAVIIPPGHRATYQATCIEMSRKMAYTSNPAPKQAACQPDSDGMTSGFPGIIEAVNPSHAFILFGQGNKYFAYLFY